MATENLLEALQAKQTHYKMTLRTLGSELGITQPFLSMLFSGKRRVTPETERKIERFLEPNPSATLAVTLESFSRKATHRSPRTQQNLFERLNPFLHHLASNGIHDPLDITRRHIEGFLKKIARGRRGRPLSENSVWTFAVQVNAFVNFIAENRAPDGWRNPVKKLPGQPKVAIRPLSRAQIDVLLGLAETCSSTEVLKARNKAMLYILLDGALRISGLLTATRYQLSQDAFYKWWAKARRSARSHSLQPLWRFSRTTLTCAKTPHPT